MDNITAHNEPHIVSVKDFRIDADYAAWLSEIKRRYISAQIKASIKVNIEKLRFNWSVGRDLVMRKAEERWGSGVVEQLSLDLKEAFPQDKGFGTTNLWAMKKWYLFFSSQEAIEKLYQAGGELQQCANRIIVKLHQVGGESDFPLLLGLVPWRHQVNIITKCKSVDEAIFYLRECILGGWSRQTLDNSFKSNLYKSHGRAISNFPEYLPEAQSRMAQEIPKDNYDFGFITVPVNYKEEQLEAALEQNITRFRAFKGIQTPMGVASYDNVQIAPSNLLPSAEELQARVRLVEEELNNNPAKV